LNGKGVAANVIIISLDIEEWCSEISYS
jgi:hypothetical protein